MTRTNSPAADPDPQDSASAQSPLPMVSIVIPVGPGDREWERLLQDLADTPCAWEIILVATEQAGSEFREWLRQLQPRAVTWLVSERRGRAFQLNLGASAAHGDFFWFLHADSRLTKAVVEHLQAAIQSDPDRLLYFRLRFTRPCSRRMILNEWGAEFRSRILGIPFGDQGFCLHRETFRRLGPFDEDLPYGEDHAYVWRCRHQRVPLRFVDASLGTSARKYSERGWLRTTTLHVWLTFRQAVSLQFSRRNATVKDPKLPESPE